MKYFIYILTVLLFSSCYDDKGNYDYKAINTVAAHLETVYAYRLEKDTIVVIHPELSQSLRENQDNLKFVWLHSTTNHNFYGHGKFDTVSVKEALAFHIEPNDSKLVYEHYFRLNVYDELTGIEYPVNTTIKLLKPYDGAWMVLHENEGQTQLGAIEYIGDKIVVAEDAYFKETGKHLRGKPLCLGQFETSCRYYGTGSSWNMFSVITDEPDEAGVYCQWNKFKKMDSLSRMVAPTVRGTFDYKNVEMIEGGSSWGALCLSGGVFYQIPTAMKIYKAPVSPDLLGELDITHASKVAFSSLMYDRAGHRFCFYHNTNRNSSYDPNIFNESKDNPVSYGINPIPIRDNNVKKSVADPNHLNPDQKVVYVGAGYQYEDVTTGFYGYGLTLKGADSCFVYELNMRGMSNSAYSTFSGYYCLKAPVGLNENSCFASTRSYSGILFYASGNKIYRLDFKQAGGKAALVYTHPSGNAVKMKFARKEECDQEFKDYEFDVNRSLGVVFDMPNGKSEFVILNLSTTGGIGTDSETWPAKQIYTEFGKIEDFLFL